MTYSPEKIAVIGSNSFSGAAFVNHALEKDSLVMGFSRSPEAPSIFLPYKKSRNLGSFQFFQTDLNRDLNSLMAVLDDFKPRYIVNFAAQAMVAESWANPDHWMMTNVVSSVRLHEALRKRDYFEKYVHVTTPEVYGSCSGNITEAAPFAPSTPYAVSRAAGDMSLMTYFKNYGFPVVMTRAANVYGAHQQLYRIIPRTILSAELGKKLQLHGGGHSVRSFIHIGDVCEATLEIARRAPVGEAYHLSTPLQISIRTLVERILQKMGVRFEDAVEVVGERPGKDAAYLLDSTKVRNALGWSDQITLDAGLAEVISWVKDNLQEIQRQPLDYIHKP